MKKFNEIILTFFYSGKIKNAPGTFGTIVSVIFWLVVGEFFNRHNLSIEIQNIFWCLFLFFLFLWGIIGIPAYSLRMREIDHKSIVIDEVIGMILALQILSIELQKLRDSEKITYFAFIIICFIIFRYFDIKKPWIIGICDRKLKNSFGVIFDDFLCGLIAGISSLFLLNIFNKFFSF